MSHQERNRHYGFDVLDPRFARVQQLYKRQRADEALALLTELREERLRTLLT